MTGTLTQPLPGHIADYRESARTVLLVMALAVTLATLWLPHPVEPARAGVLVLAAVVGLTALVSTIPAAHGLLNRVGGLIVLVQISALVVLTGGPDSVYQPLYVVLLLYAAVFYGSARLLATGVVILTVLLIPAVAQGQPADVTAVIVKASVWFVAVGAVHWLVGRIRQSAQTDGLTGLLNHVTFWHLVRAEHDRATRYGRDYSLLLIDLDHFKRINDTYGHRAGDEVLRSIARLLTERCRSTDILARYGGEEFAIILPETDLVTATELAKELRLRVNAVRSRWPVTVSIGVAGSRAFPGSADAVVTAADRALYEAKRAGRNHVGLADTDAPHVTAPLTAT